MARWLDRPTWDLRVTPNVIKRTGERPTGAPVGVAASRLRRIRIDHLRASANVSGPRSIGDRRPLWPGRPVDAARRTQLVATIGPASVDHVEALARAGMEVARVNFSHGTSADHAAAAAAVREAAATTGIPMAVLVDLAGPKVRLGELSAGSIDLVTGQTFRLRGDPGPGDARSAGTNHPDITADLRVGDRILLADGDAELRVLEAGREIVTEVVSGGTIRSRAGVNIPGDRLSLAAVSERDRRDVARGLGELGADIVAQSFVRRAEDVEELRTLLEGSVVTLMAKIETRAAIDDIERILAAADAIMVARGDLGVEIPFEEVPIVQKELIRSAHRHRKPVVVATQMLESMTDAPRPTRAEASDVANAVLDGADGILLSAETAIGRFPVEAAEAATSISRVAEAAADRWSADLQSASADRAERG